MSTSLLTLLLSIHIHVIYSITCNGDCACTNNGPCDMSCSGTNTCHNTNVGDYGGYTLTCKSGYPCTISCISGDSPCEDSIFDGSTATDVIINCNDNEACKRATVHCGSGDCTINCIGTIQNDACDRMRINCGSSKSCNLYCPASATQPCQDIVVNIENTDAYKCEGPTNADHCRDALPPAFTASPTSNPTALPTSHAPTTDPTADPTKDPTSDPTADPTTDPTADPTTDPTSDPTINPTSNPSGAPIMISNATKQPTERPTTSPTDNGQNGNVGDDTTSTTGSGVEVGGDDKGTNEGDADYKSTLLWGGIGLGLLGGCIILSVLYCIIVEKAKKKKIQDFKRVELVNHTVPGQDHRTETIVSAPKYTMEYMEKNEIYGEGNDNYNNTTQQLHEMDEAGDDEEDKMRLFYQAQFMQMMMVNPQQQAFLMNMDPNQRQLYIEHECNLYIQRVENMHQNNMLPMMNTQAIYSEGNDDDDDDGYDEETQSDGSSTDEDVVNDIENETGFKRNIQEKGIDEYYE